MRQTNLPSLVMTPIDAVLFDLDGTLADTAPDLAAAASRVATERGLPAVLAKSIRAAVSQGAAGILRVATGAETDDPGFPTLRERFLDYYAEAVGRQTRLYEGVDDALRQLEAAGVRWGIVTNKHERFGATLLQELGLSARASAIVYGDTLPQTKPHPAPLLLAAKQLNLHPGQCLYVGDHRRDIEAGAAAGMKTAAATWDARLSQTPDPDGSTSHYWPETDPPEAWGPSYILSAPGEIATLVNESRSTRG